MENWENNEIYKSAIYELEHCPIVLKVRRMREAQKKYFKTKNKNDLAEAKALEKEVDFLINPPKTFFQEAVKGNFKKWEETTRKI